MKKSQLITLATIFLVVVVFYFLWPYAFTVVPIKQVEEQKLSEAFNPVSYVDSIWQSKVIPTIMEKAIDLSTVLKAIPINAKGMISKSDLTQTTKPYALSTVGEALVFKVKAKGKIEEVDTSSSLGNMTIKVDGYDGPIKVNVFIGPRIPSDETSIRDGVGFISFGDFKEQTEYGKAARELNNRVTGQVLEPLDKTKLKGKIVIIYGTFTLRTFNLTEIDMNKITIVPVKIDLSE